MTFSRPRVVKALPYALVLAAAVFLYIVATQIDFHQRAGTLGPDFWPKAILTLLAATCVFEIARVLLTRTPDTEVTGVLENIVERASGVVQDGGERVAEQHAEMAAEVAAEHHPVLLALGIASTLAYVALVSRMGFFLSTSIYIAGFLAIGGYRRWRVLAAVSVGGALVLMFVFMKVVYISLPIGVAPFSAVTLFLMQVMGIR